MIYHRSDRLFEEAGRSPESCDKLLKRLQRARKVGFISILGVALVVLALCLSTIIPLVHWLRSPAFPMSPAPDWLTSLISPSLIYAIAVPVFTGLAVQFAFLIHNDICIKMLLFIRGHQARLNTAGDNSRNA